MLPHSCFHLLSSLSPSRFIGAVKGDCYRFVLPALSWRCHPLKGSSFSSNWIIFLIYNKKVLFWFSAHHLSVISCHCFILVCLLLKPSQPHPFVPSFRLIPVGCRCSSSSVSTKTLTSPTPACSCAWTSTVSGYAARSARSWRSRRGRRICAGPPRTKETPSRWTHSSAAPSVSWSSSMLSCRSWMHT